MLKELNDKLKRFTKPVKAEMTPEEMETLKKVFQIDGSYEALYKWFLIDDEFTKGVSLSMEIEEIPTVAQGMSKEDIADNVQYLQTMTRHIRQKFDSLKQEFVKQIKAEISEIEKSNEEERIKNQEKVADQIQEEKGVGVNA